MDSDTMLSGYRALDLTDHRGHLGGRVLADLGAEVIKVEPPGGEPGRWRGPFYGGETHPEQGLFWLSYNLGKKSITLNLERSEGRELLLRLAQKADFLLESFPPGYMDSLGLGYGVLSQGNPGLIYASLSPFGQSGPYRDYKATDIVAMAMGGFMSLTGDPERPPLRVSFPLAYALSAIQLAQGCLLAFHYRQRTGLGQWVDVSAQESVAATSLNACPSWELNQVLIKRTGRFRSGVSSGVQQRQVWPCQDGAVAFMLLGGGGGAQSNRALVKWLEEEGMGDPFLSSVDWDAFDMATASQEFHQRVEAVIGRFFLSHTKRELHQGAVERGIWLQPVSTPRDIAESPQLAARDFWAEIPHPELKAALRFPGPFVRGLSSPCRLGRRAPLVGADNEAIYSKDLGLSPAALKGLQERGII